ncbi:hypothetical protein GVAV_000095 [Gurleya vavrai]
MQTVIVNECFCHSLALQLATPTHETYESRRKAVRKLASSIVLAQIKNCRKIKKIYKKKKDWTNEIANYIKESEKKKNLLKCKAEPRKIFNQLRNILKIEIKKIKKKNAENKKFGREKKNKEMNT